MVCIAKGPEVINRTDFQFSVLGPNISLMDIRRVTSGSTVDVRRISETHPFILYKKRMISVDIIRTEKQNSATEFRGRTLHVDLVLLPLKVWSPIGRFKNEEGRTVSGTFASPNQHRSQF